jgi:hypothetical protein
MRWSAEDLARESALGVTTIRRAELIESETSMTTVNDLAVRRGLRSRTPGPVVPSSSTNITPAASNARPIRRRPFGQ